MSLPEPYYQDDACTIYHGDCREIVPDLWFGVGLVLTDPPYPDCHTEIYAQAELNLLDALYCRQLIFWSAKADFPLDHTAVHIWDKVRGSGSQYERIFERNGQRVYKVFRQISINSHLAASFTGDTFTGHPSQKPVKLIAELLAKFSSPGALVLDPFMGSGSTLAAAKDMNRHAIGIEVDERYCEIAASRLAQEVLPLEIA